MLRWKDTRRLRVLEPRRAEEIALDRARSGAPISPDATERQSAPTELTVAGGPRVRILLAPAGSQGELHELAMTRNRWFESISLQRRVVRTPVWASHETSAWSSSPHRGGPVKSRNIAKSRGSGLRQSRSRAGRTDVRQFTSEEFWTDHPFGSTPRRHPCADGRSRARAVRQVRRRHRKC